MPVTIRYEANNVEFAQLMMAEQTQDLADQAANLGVRYARMYATGLKLPAEYIASIRAVVGPIVVLGPRRNPRRTARVVARYPWIEFGSGKSAAGRPQGGNSPAYRILGRTGSRIGQPPRGSGGS